MMRGLPLVLLLFVGIGCRSSTQPTVADDDAYAVYRVAIPAIDEDSFSRASRVLILQETRTFPDNPSPLGGCAPSDPQWRPVVDDYDRANSGGPTVRRRFSFTVPTTLISPADMQTLDTRSLSKYGWAGFRKRFAGATRYYVVSAVGFNPAKTQALVYVEHFHMMFGEHACVWPACSDGRYFFLVRRDSEWQLPAGLNEAACKQLNIDGPFAY